MTPATVQYLVTLCPLAVVIGAAVIAIAAWIAFGPHKGRH